jgi:hypothetical protein
MPDPDDVQNNDNREHVTEILESFDQFTWGDTVPLASIQNAFSYDDLFADNTNEQPQDLSGTSPSATGNEGPVPLLPLNTKDDPPVEPETASGLPNLEPNRSEAPTIEAFPVAHQYLDLMFDSLFTVDSIDGRIVPRFSQTPLPDPVNHFSGISFDTAFSSPHAAFDGMLLEEPAPSEVRTLQSQSEQTLFTQTLCDAHNECLAPAPFFLSSPRTNILPNSPTGEVIDLTSGSEHSADLRKHHVAHETLIKECERNSTEDNLSPRSCRSKVWLNIRKRQAQPLEDTQIQDLEQRILQNPEQIPVEPKCKKARYFRESYTLTTRTRRLLKPILQGNNSSGNKGLRKCLRCRSRKMKVLALPIPLTEFRSVFSTLLKIHARRVRLASIVVLQVTKYLVRKNETPKPFKRL